MQGKNRRFTIMLTRYDNGIGYYFLINCDDNRRFTLLISKTTF